MRNQTTVVLILASGVSTIVYLAAARQIPPPAPARSAPGATQAAENAGAKNAAEPPAGELKFSPADALVLNVDRKNVGDVKAQLAVRNSSTTTPYKPNHTLDSMGFVDSLGKEAAWDKVIDISGAAETLGPGDSEHLVLHWKKDSNVQTGTYEGFLIVSQDKKEVARQVVRVVVPDPLSAMQPLISKLSLRAYRYFPFASSWWTPAWTSPGIPLRAAVNADRAGLTHTPLLVVATRDFAGTAAIYWDGNETTLAAAEPVLGVRVKSIPFAGKYDGALSFGKDAGSGVALTLNASDLVIYPLIWLAFCIWIAIRGKRWLGGERQLTQWRTGVLLAQKHMESAEETFGGTVKGASHGYSLHEAFTGQCQAIWAKIDELRGILLGSLDTSSPAYQFVNTKVPELEEFPKAWVAFGGQLEALKQAMAEVAPGAPPLGLDSRPAALQQTDTLLQAKAMTLEQFAAQQTQVAAQTAFLDQWNELWPAVQRIHAGMADFKSQCAQYVALHNDDVTAVDDQVNAVRARLWLLSGADDAANIDAAAAVESAKEKYSGLLEAAKFDEPGREKMLVKSMPKLKEARAEPEWSPQAVSVKNLQKQLTNTDGVLGFLSYLLAVLTGLNQLYFGKPFGTVSDYVTLTLWAFGAKVAVDALSGGLERWVGSKTG